MMESMIRFGLTLFLCLDSVTRSLDVSGALDVVGRDRVFHTVHDAVTLIYRASGQAVYSSITKI